MKSAMNKLLKGYAKFHNEVFPANRDAFSALAKGQSPHTLFITCADSRVVPNLITQTSPGEIFTVRNVGNIVPAFGEVMGGVSSAIEYAVAALGVERVVILGHADCGAMKALLFPEDVVHMKAVSTWLQQAAAALHIVKENSPELEGKALLERLTEENVVVQLNHLRTHPAVAARLRRNDIELHGWVYEICDGSVRAYDEETRQFESLPVPVDQELMGALVGHDR